MILADTNAWVRHLRRKDPRLIRFLEENRTVTCDVVIGELLLGADLPTAFLEDLRLLPKVASPSVAETREYVERHHRTFHASGVGWADAEIIAAAAKAGARVYSSDRAVRSVWGKLGHRLA